MLYVKALGIIKVLHKTRKRNSFFPTRPNWSDKNFNSLKSCLYTYIASPRAVSLLKAAFRSLESLVWRGYPKSHVEKDRRVSAKGMFNNYTMKYSFSHIRKALRGKKTPFIEGEKIIFWSRGEGRLQAEKKIMNFSLIHTEKWGNSFGISPSCESIPVLLKPLLFRKQSWDKPEKNRCYMV